ncbi:uncharacterized protein HHUB_6097 (plasmid) [Halobacterium hubeiense]|uniref:Uncharacterized protein n=2 Tax=Halobacterium hubeiense TaxID=1407499 RepID=A0A0U5H8V1_9EURY|nr:uncharacterized protein HHUB_6097 [Halobacterium hubeiense]
MTSGQPSEEEEERTEMDPWDAFIEAYTGVPGGLKQALEDDESKSYTLNKMQQARIGMSELNDDGSPSIRYQTKRFYSLKKEIENGPQTLREKVPDGFSDEEIFERMEAVLLRRPVNDLFLLVGSLIETLSIKAVLDNVIDENRVSNNVEEHVERLPQTEREWWLFSTGVIDAGEKGKIREAYRLRNNIAHMKDSSGNLYSKSDVMTAVEDAEEAINILHTSVWDFTLKHRKVIS